MKDVSESGAWPVDDLYSFLQGSWSLYRTMNDLRLNMPGAMQGDVHIIQDTAVADGGDLVYREQGELRFGDYREVVHRSYIYKFPDRYNAGHLGEVHFEHGGLFHLLDLSAGFQKVTHICKDDTYRGRVLVEGADIWHLNWFVTGPSKEIVIDSRYQRMA